MQKLIIIMCVMISAAFENICSANYYENSPDYVYVTIGNGYNDYFYLPSVDVQEYNLSHYQIAGRYQITFRKENGYW